MNALEALKAVEEKIRRGENAREDFWKLVGIVKRSKSVDEETLVRIAKIREEIFDKKLVLSLKSGTVIFASLVVLSNMLFLLISFKNLQFLLKAALLFAVESAVIYSSFIVGRLIGSLITGIKILGFYRYNPLELGMKLDIVSYLKAEQKNRVIFFLTPIVFENSVFLFQSLLLVYFNNEFYWVPLLLAISNLLLSYAVYKIKKTGELYRLIREIKILRELSEKPSAEKNQEHRKKS
ncbi:hypothetical protein Ferp_0022 [Ferroglobus placidus DSM 10642]|uniref:Uncharacterized protein n=1 Tax=Ferroglobus placidus (strain DSM 10642 / AEDII12DO) TaxID=589924 RepID=D3S0K0_FERPA|nr:hypothetical protein [Ferroglobus placidus]ADC64214.1 hypothetical protein Ferp_0022 [Ferroglobus placidus DSM 10642]